MATKSKKKTESTGLYTAGFVLGIIGVVFAFIPLCYWIAYILGALALIFGIIGLVKKAEGHKPLVATILGAVAIIVGIVMNVLAVRAAQELLNGVESIINETSNSIFENYADDVLGKTVEVDIEGYKAVENNFWGDNAVVVTIKNISDKTLNFSISIEALDEDGNRLDTDTVYAESLAPGQSTTENTFTLSELSEDVLGSATYRVFKATSY